MWPIAETEDVLRERWDALLTATDRQAAFRESRDRTISGRYPSLDDPTLRSKPLREETVTDPVPGIARFGFRSLDRQWLLK